jgi:hypothetical protein
MSVAAQPMSPAFFMLSYPMRRFTVDEYHRMIQAGILTEDDSVELLEGWIVLKMARNPPHDGTIEVTRELLGSRLPSGWKIRVQSAITTADSEPEPDIAIVSGTVRAHLDHHPGPQEVAGLIEVADSTLIGDRQDKGRLYARAGIVWYWIINLIDRQVEVYTDPSGPDPNPRYRQRQDFGLQDAVPLVIAGQEVARIPVQEIFPSP